MRYLASAAIVMVVLAASACGVSPGGSGSGGLGPGTTSAAAVTGASSAPGGCSVISAKYPSLKGKTLTDAIVPFTPGYESAAPNNPSTYVGFDIDLLGALGSCLGFTARYKPVAFASLLPTLQAGQANIVVSDIYATTQRAKAANFVTYEKVFDGILVRKGNPKGIHGINTTLCGLTAAENTGFVEVPLVQAQASACKADGKAAPKLQLYNNNADCIQAVLAGRADTYINDVNTVDQAVAAHPTELAKAAAVTLPYSVGIAVPKSNTTLLNAVYDSLVQIQKDGIETNLLNKWKLAAGSITTPTIVR